MGVGAAVAAVCMIAAGCSATGDDQRDRTTLGPQTTVPFTYPVPPAVRRVETTTAAVAFEALVTDMSLGGLGTHRLDALVGTGDARHAWLIADLLRFTVDDRAVDALVAAFVELTGADPATDPTFATSPWKSVTDHLIAWDLPAPPDYRRLKAGLFTLVEPRWAPFFADTDAAIDWRWVSWGGVLIDDRPLGASAPCRRGCIPALDDPVLTDAAGGDWHPEDRIVFGVVEGDQVVALPKHIMEVHELVNMTLGGRRLAIPYCTLCGSAQAYYTDRLPADVDPLVLRTSGLLSRSNKMMYDLTSLSVFDTFTGAAVSGPLQDANVVLDQQTVTVTTWGQWRDAHPDTRIIAQDGGIGRAYDLDPLGARDADGPIFPIGAVDPRLPVHEPVVGVITGNGTPLAFPARAARDALAAGDDVTMSGVELIDDGGGLRARTVDGAELAAHEAFWFAWSQFHPDTQLWDPPETGEGPRDREGLVERRSDVDHRHAQRRFPTGRRGGARAVRRHHLLAHDTIAPFPPRPPDHLPRQRQVSGGGGAQTHERGGRAPLPRKRRHGSRPG